MNAATKYVKICNHRIIESCNKFLSTGFGCDETSTYSCVDVSSYVSCAKHTFTVNGPGFYKLDLMSPMDWYI